MMRPRFLGVVMAVFLLGEYETKSFSQVCATLEHPVAARAGVIAIPLRQQTGQDKWPTHITIERSDGGEPIEGVVAWIGAKPISTQRSWTQSQEQLDIRQIEFAPQDKNAMESGMVVLLAKTPADIQGALEVGVSKVEPEWLELSEVEPDPAKLPLKPSASYALPDPSEPAEWFRWWLLADQIDRKPPPPQGHQAQQLFALYRAQLWQAGIERVERQSPGVAAEIRERLTAVCVESDSLQRPSPKAAWIANAQELANLLSNLISTERSDEQAMQASLNIIRAISPMTLWPETDDGRALHFCACNASAEEIVVQFSWVESPTMPSLAMRLPPHGISRIEIQRPAELMPDPLTGEPSPTVGSLLLTWPGNSTRISVSPAQSVIRPPGYSLGVFLPGLSLADAQTGKIQPTPALWSTTASLRRKFAHWEIFVECLREEVRIGDELDVMIGDRSHLMARIQLTEAGVRKVDSPNGTPAPIVRTDSFTDRWRCVIEIPEEWLPGDSNARPFVVGIARTTHGPSSRQTAIAAAPPWQMGPPLVQLETSKWIDPPVQRVIAPP